MNYKFNPIIIFKKKLSKYNQTQIKNKKIIKKYLTKINN